MIALFALTLAALADLAPPDPAWELAHQVAAACGDPYALDELRFTFVVEAGGAEKARRSHAWSPRTGALSVTADGATVALRVEEDMPTSEADPRWATLATGVDPGAAATAWARFVNDSYWLLAPCKAADDGVRHGIDQDGRLILSFDGVGLTPGDRYVLWSTAADPVVAGWSFALQSGREDSFRWVDQQDVGPLHLSLRRESTTSDTVIRFEGVSAR